MYKEVNNKSYLFLLLKRNFKNSSKGRHNGCAEGENPVTSRKNCDCISLIDESHNKSYKAFLQQEENSFGRHQLRTINIELRDRKVKSIDGDSFGKLN